MTPCSIDGCARDAWQRGWCQPHYTRWYRHGDPLAGRRSPGTRPRCKVRTCTRRAVSHGMCDAHRTRWQRDGDPQPDKPISWSRAPVRRWRAVALIPYVDSYRELGRMLGLASRTAERWERVLITTAQADDIAASLGMHPCEIWPEWLEVAA